MKKLIVFLLAVVLLESCSECFECEQNIQGGKVEFDVCSSNFNSKQDWKNYIESIEDSDSVSMTCRRRLF